MTVRRSELALAAAVAASLVIAAQPAFAATLRVPQDHQAIQAAIDASNPGGVVICQTSISPSLSRVP